ncbi:MAG: glutamate racemase [Actinobacteria bacterium]|nr:glutamate racemase [Actinomycetota bacterium]
MTPEKTDIAQTQSTCYTDAAIGIFDSGIGGLTVAREIARALPHESILYFGDTIRCPYGPRPLSEVRTFVRQIGTWLCNHDVKLMVIACNTATAAGLEVAQREFDVPVIGVIEPGARAAVHATMNRRVGVIATVATIESGAYTKAIRSLDAGITVFSSATPRFVDIAEEGLRLDSSLMEDFWASVSKAYIRPEFQEIARDYLDPIKRCGIDTLVMGCTHFPLLKPLIGSIIGHNVKLISSAEETAREVFETLSAREQLATGVPRYQFATTAENVDEFALLGSRIFGHPIDSIERVTLSQLEAMVHPVRREDL